ncbi:hypothetical protein F5Y04DRAFT_14112 [Hypomontagnella monticulosa]|nr:hypothetical protein F5Y04DRAFT_14112 [Hypomontagnella monticulosa]
MSNPESLFQGPIADLRDSWLACEDEKKNTTSNPPKAICELADILPHAQQALLSINQTQHAIAERDEVAVRLRSTASQLLEQFKTLHNDEAITKVPKVNTIKTLVRNILQDILNIAQRTNTDKSQITIIENELRKVSHVSELLENNNNNHSIHNMGNGPQLVHLGHGEQNVNTGTGTQLNGHFHGPVNTGKSV